MTTKKPIATCHQCGEKSAVNTSGICADCWIKFSSLRKNPEAKW